MVVAKNPTIGIIATTVGISNTTIVLLQLIDKIFRDDVCRAVDILGEAMVEILLKHILALGPYLVETLTIGIGNDTVCIAVYNQC